jgi:hypothetical protein
MHSTAMCLRPMGTGVSSTGVSRGAGAVAGKEEEKEEEGRIRDGSAFPPLK